MAEIRVEITSGIRFDQDFDGNMVLNPFSKG